MTNIDSIQDSTRYVVSGMHRGSILPGTRLEMGRDVYLDSGADVRGGIWCGSLSVSGAEVNVAESVYCLGSARIGPSEVEIGEGVVTFGSCISASESLSIQPGTSKVRFLSDIYTGQVNISNAFVYGNIFADRAVIRDSIVLGGVYCENSLTVERSLISTFSAGRAVVGEGTGLFFTYAVADENIDLQAPVRVLTFYTLYMQTEDAGDVVLLDDEDLVTISVDGDPNSAQGVGGQQIHCLSVMERVLDSEPLGKHILFNKKFIECLALHNSMVPDARPPYFEGPLEDLEAALWDVLSGGDASAGRRAGGSIQELFNRLSSSRSE